MVRSKHLNISDPSNKSEIETLHNLKKDGFPVLILIYANWCPACKNFKPDWTKLVGKYEGDGDEPDVYMASIEESALGDIDSDIAEVSYFPTLKTINEDGSVDVYSDERSPEKLDEVIKTLSEKGKKKKGKSKRGKKQSGGGKKRRKTHRKSKKARKTKRIKRTKHRRTKRRYRR